MGFDKAKAIRAAEKYIGQGKIPSAIGEYRRIVEEDRNDFAALNTLGDLYARTGKKEEAAQCFTGVAEHYRAQGFSLKAIAMYKKILRLKPDSLDASAKLAALYEGQGLNVDARAQYLSIADAYARAGRAGEMLEVLHRVAALEPQNAQVRLRIADAAAREGRSEEAATAYAEAGERLLARREHEQALEAFTKALDLAPDDSRSLGGLVSAHSALGTSDEAAEILEKLVAESPDDAELLSMLVRAYLDAENAQAAERAVEQLVRREAGNERFFVDVARLHLEEGASDEAVRVTARAVEPLLAAREEDALLEILNEVTARDPEQTEALRLLVRIHAWQRDDEGTRGALERLAEASREAGAKEEERGALMQLVRLAPDEESYRERLQALGGWAGAAGTTGGDEIGATPLAEEVPTFESFMISNDDYAESASPAASIEGNETPPAQFAEFEWNTVEPAAAPASATAEASVSFADLNDDFGDANSSVTSAPSVDVTFAAPTPAQEEGQAFDDFQTVNFGALHAEPPAEVEELSRTAVGNDRLESQLKQEMESVDFYLAQGYADIARDTLDMLERQYGRHPQIDERRAQLESQLRDSIASDEGTPAAAQSATPALEVEYSGFASYDVETETAPAAVGAAVDQALVDFAIETPSPAIATPGSSAPSSDASAATPGLDAGLSDIFDEHRVAVEGEEPPPVADYETHYNLGLAYQEMDLQDEAIEEFQKAAALSAPQDGTPRYLQCCNLLGHCFMRKGMGQIAAMWFRRGLDTPGHTEDEYQALRYELGAAYELMGDTERAIEMFTEVYGINVGYRGVSDKLRELRAQREKKVGSER